jgi:perosamine synthetase
VARQPFELLEDEVADWAGYPRGHVVSCSSGTAALHIALEALQLPQGATVIMPDLTMVACARAVHLAGLVPQFVDCKDDLNMDVRQIDSTQLRSTAAFMAVHLYGRCAFKMFGFNNLRVVEDMAEAHGVRPHAETDAACWSFYRNKIVAGEEGRRRGVQRPEARNPGAVPTLPGLYRRPRLQPRPRAATTTA